MVSDDRVIWVRWIRTDFASRKISSEIKKRLASGLLKPNEARIATGKILIRFGALKELVHDILQSDPGFNLDYGAAVDNGMDLPHPLDEYLTPSEWAKKLGVSRQWIHQMVQRRKIKSIKWESPKPGSDHFTLYHVPPEE